jgi:hypothetical protein
MEFFERTEKMVAVADYYRSAFLWHHYCVRQQFGYRSLYLYHLLMSKTFIRLENHALSLRKDACPQLH